jgi:putative tricarboxylic transport membrane protein
MAITLIFGVIAYFLRKQNYPTVTLLLGFILGPMLEDYFRRGLSLGHGSPLIFFTSPDSLFFLVLTVIFYYFLMIKKPMIMKEDLVQKKAK